MDAKDKEIESLRIQLKAQVQKNSAIDQEMALLKDENYKLLKEVYRMLKKIDDNFRGFEKETNSVDEDL